MLISKPIHILGAGPAGLCSAIALAHAGREVHIHERYDTIGKRFRGDLQGLENWTSKENVLDQLQNFGIKTTFTATPFSEVTITDGRSSFVRKSKKPLFYLVKRGPFSDSLDTALGNQAEEIGVKIHYRSKLAVENTDIIATGPLRNALIASDKGVVFQTNLPNMAVAIFNDELAFLGYSYLLVSDGYGCLCTVVFQDFHRLNSCFENTIALAKRLYPIDLTNAHPVGGIGSFSLNHPKQLGNSLLVGEAAGFQDLLWGFGIRTALTSGHLAARSLLDKQNYSELVEKTLKPQLKASMVNRFLWETLKIGPRPILPFLFRIPNSLHSDFHHLYRFTLFHRLLYPFALRYIKHRYQNSVDYAKFQNEPIQEENNDSL